jgi:hypothetical protein
MSVETLFRCMALKRDGEVCMEPATQLHRAQGHDAFYTCDQHVWEALDTPPQIPPPYRPCCPFPSTQLGVDAAR